MIVLSLNGIDDGPHPTPFIHHVVAQRNPISEKAACYKH
jgi:hypothetical protein